jgi:NADH:ubiquinone oxidoreductase subunit 5 (subunit L)/multisubunit Na+/H+ antiporter MnhA subunit
LAGWVCVLAGRLWLPAGWPLRRCWRPGFHSYSWQQTVQTRQTAATIGTVSLAVDGISLLLAGTVLTLGALVLIFSICLYARG